MSTIVINSALFSVEPEGDLEFCNGQPGSEFANWLKDKLVEKKLQCDSVIQEDYGWGFWINSEGTTFWVCVSYAGEESDPLQGEWFASVSHEIPLLIFKPWLWSKAKSGVQEEKRIYGFIKDAISAESQIEILREE